MYILIEDGIVTTEIRPTSDKFDAALLLQQNFIEVDDEDFEVVNHIYDASTGTYTPKPVTAFEVRRDRDFILQNEVDPIVSNPLRWDAMTAEKQQEWKDYRNALLNITEQEGFPENVTWPTKP